MGDQKDLNINITLKPSTYDVHYIVKDNVTGISFDTVFKLTVATAIYEGWLIMSDVSANKPRLDMIASTPDQPTAKVIYDVLDYTHSNLKLTGNAVDVDCFDNCLYNGSVFGIYVTTTGNGTTRIEPDNFSWDQTMNIAYESVGGAFASDFSADSMQPIDNFGTPSGANFLYSKGNIYYFTRSYGIKYGLAINKLDTEQIFDAAPFISEGGQFDAHVVFDRTKKRFIQISSFGTCSEMATYDPSTMYFDYNDTQSTLIYMTTSRFNNNERFAVMKKDSDNTFWLARFASFTQNYYKEILNAPDFDKAEKFAVSPDNGYLFYSVGGKLYEYDFGLQKAKLMINKGSDNITYIGFHYASNDPEKLVLCSYNGTEGKMELFTVPTLNGDLELSNSWAGFGKIVKVAYRFR